MSAARPLLLRDAELVPGQRADLRIANGVIVAIGAGLEAADGERVIEARGGALLRGLHDHHLHLFATAAALRSVFCGPPEVHDAAALAGRLAASVPGSDGWIRGIGFHESVVPDMDRQWLDAVCATVPVRIQHRSGMLWVLNSRALEAIGLDASSALPPGAGRLPDGSPDGRFIGLDAWIGERVQRQLPSLLDLGQRLARFGITGVTDAGPRNGVSEWQHLRDAQAHGDLRQRVLLMGNEDLGALSGEDSASLAVGPLKIYLREAELPAPEAVVARITAARVQQRAVACHCVTRTELVLALATLEQAGAVDGDRIEHASVVDDEALAWIARLGVRVVTQPHFIHERGDQYLLRVEPADQPWLYRGASFLAAGVPLAAGSDAPYGDFDPWACMRAAITRQSAAGACIGASEALSPAQALALFDSEPRRAGTPRAPLAAGEAADLCLLDVPREELLNDLDARHVRATIAAGRLLYPLAPGLAAHD